VACNPEELALGPRNGSQRLARLDFCAGSGRRKRRGLRDVRGVPLPCVTLRWVRTGYGGHHRPRPLLICQCGRSITKLYFKGGHLACRRCTNAVYASQVCSGRTTRAQLQTKRLQNFLQLKSYLSKRNRQRIAARVTIAPEQELNSKRLAHSAILLPQSNHSTRGAMHWR